MTTTLMYAGALIGFLVLVLLWKQFRRKTQKPWIQVTTCQNCGWKGQTSRYAGRCPKCNSLIGDQRGSGSSG